MQLIRFQCLSILRYGSEVLVDKRSQTSVLDICLIRFVMKIFRSSQRPLILDSLNYMGEPLPGDSIGTTEQRSRQKLNVSGNIFVRTWS
jgi:hypothetical protein